ncbi:hypothetical protein D3C85_551810 [compost metagenome]
MGHSHVAIDLSGANMKDAHHGKALEPRKHARRRYRDFGRDEGDLVAQAHAQLGGGLVADDDAEGTGFEVLQAALPKEIADDRNLRLLERIDGIDQHLLHLALIREQALHLAEWRNGQHLRILQRGVGEAAPIIDGRRRLDGGMRHHTEHAGAHLMVEAVHHRQHHDHHEHTECQPDHRSQGNKGDEVVAAFGTGVTRTYIDEQGSEHVGG